MLHNFTLPPTTTNPEGAATSVGHVDGEGEPGNRRGGRFIQGSFTLRFVEYVVEDEQRLIVAGVDDGADLDSQANRRCATFNRDVSVFCKRGKHQ